MIRGRPSTPRRLNDESEMAAPDASRSSPACLELINQQLSLEESCFMALTGLSADPKPIRVIQKYSKTSMSWPGLTRPSTQLRRHLPAVPNLGNIISPLITWFSVLVEGRVTPGHDEKPKGRRVTSNS